MKIIKKKKCGRKYLNLLAYSLHLKSNKFTFFDNITTHTHAQTVFCVSVLYQIPKNPIISKGKYIPSLRDIHFMSVHAYSKCNPFFSVISLIYIFLKSHIYITYTQLWKYIPTRCFRGFLNS